VRIRCLALPSVLYIYQFKADKYIESLSVVNRCPPSLHVHWPSFEAEHILEGISIKFPANILISPWTAFRVRRILSGQSFYALCRLSYNGNYRLIDFESSTPVSDNAVFIGDKAKADIEAIQTGNLPGSISVPLPLRLYPSLNNLPTVD